MLDRGQPATWPMVKTLKIAPYTAVSHAVIQILTLVSPRICFLDLVRPDEGGMPMSHEDDIPNSIPFHLTLSLHLPRILFTNLSYLRFDNPEYIELIPVVCRLTLCLSRLHINFGNGWRSRPNTLLTQFTPLPHVRDLRISYRPDMTMSHAPDAIPVIAALLDNCPNTTSLSLRYTPDGIGRAPSLLLEAVERLPHLVQLMWSDLGLYSYNPIEDYTANGLHLSTVRRLISTVWFEYCSSCDLPVSL